MGAVVICNPEKLSCLVPLFDGWQETMIWSCLSGMMGTVYVSDGTLRSAAAPRSCAVPRSSAALLNDFCFFAGEPDAALAANDFGRDFLIYVPQNGAWAELFETTLGDKLQKRTRYAIQKDPACFDREHLRRIVGTLPDRYRLCPIDRRRYEECLKTGQFRDFVAGYPDYETYARQGIGYVVTEDDHIIAGASSYSSYPHGYGDGMTAFPPGIEIEIDTHPDYRRQGLASVCGAALILACLDRGWYPSWDAHNPISVKLAEKLGYTFDHEYTVYERY